jgi:D-3-phosphoglycerate dehydrogenase
MVGKKTIYIADKLSQEAVDVLSSESCIHIENQPGLPLEEKLELVRRCHGLIVRSATQVDEALLAVAENLEVVVRAGVGIDNIDVNAATRKGVVVQNVPEGNTRSAAEHTVAMILSLARNVPQACADLRAGRWERTKYVGTELQGKTLGLVGVGKIGAQVLQMAQGLGMSAIIYDPYISPQKADEMGVKMATTIEELVAAVHFLTVHVPLVPETRNLISADLLAKARPGLFVINCARGGIVDEDGLVAALESGQVKGAALDVFSTEPPENRKLLDHPGVVVTPHLGASTREAQSNVAVGAAQLLLDYFVHGRLGSPINTISLAPDLRAGVQPFFDLAYRLGRLQSQLLEGNPSRFRIRLFGDMFEGELIHYLKSAALSGFLEDRSAQPVNAINAQHLASEKGIAVEEVSEGRSKYFHEMIKIVVEDSAGRREVGGTIRGHRGLRLVSLNEYQFDAVLEGRLLIVQNEDRPGMIGTIGNTLASHKANVSSMSLGRDQSGGNAVALLNLDNDVDSRVVEQLAQSEGIIDVKLVRLPDRTD